MTLLFRECEDHTADPCRGCISHLKFSLCCTMKVQHCKSRGVLNKNADPECGGCISVRSCRSAATANTCNFSANAEHLVPRVRPGPLDHVQYKEPWPEATLPRCAGVMVVPSLRRPASRCRGFWRPPAGAQLHLHTCVKGSAQAVKPDVCRCAAFKNKVISSHTVSTKRRM